MSISINPTLPVIAAQGVAADLVHQRGNLGCAFDGLERCGHGLIRGAFLSCPAKPRECVGACCGRPSPHVSRPLRGFSVAENAELGVTRRR